MALDTTVQGSVGWWMARLGKQLDGKQQRMALLDAYWRGEPPLVQATPQQQSAFWALQRTARSNFAALIVQAPRERLSVRAIRTGVVSDDDGDEQAWALWNGSDMPVAEADIYRMQLEFGEAYGAVGLNADGTVLMTAEDPRQMITAQDPTNPRVAIAALKVYHDDVRDLDLAMLWLPGQLHVATRETSTAVTTPQPAGPLNGYYQQPPFQAVSFSPTSFTLDETLGETFTSNVVPVVRYVNRDGVGEYEAHLALLDRINHEILQRVVITTLQAFRQRAIKTAEAEDLPETDDQGRTIDYDNLFAADPGALWMLPPGADIWESNQADISGILNAVKDDVLHLSAVTRTPLAMFTPDAATQTAEGASFMREGLTYKVEDIQRIDGRGHARMLSVAFLFLGDEQRADLTKLAVDWNPAARYSLIEMGTADTAALSLPNKVKWQLIWQMTPQQIAQAEADAQDQAALQQQLALQQAQAEQTLQLQGQVPPAV